MNKTLWTRRLGAGLLAVMLLVGLCACGEDTAPTTTVADGTTTTLADEVTTTVADGETTTTVAGDTTTVADATTTVAQATTTKATPTTKKPGGAALTLDQVMAKMPANLRGTTLTVASWSEYHNMPIGTGLRAFEKASGITVKFDIMGKNEFPTTVAARITAGNAPDVLIADNNNIDYIKNFQPITNSGYDVSTADWDQEISKQFTFNGRVYAVAPADSVSHNFLIMTYSKLAIKRSKLPDPWTEYQKDHSWWTWDKVWEMCDQFLENTGRKNGYWGANFGPENYCRCFGAGLERYDPNQGKYATTVNSPNTVKRYEILVDAIEKNWCKSATDATAFKQGKILFGFAASSYVEKDHPFYDPDSTGYMPVPVDSTTNPVQGFMAHGLCIGAKNKEAAPYMIRYTFSKEVNPDFFSDKGYEEFIFDMVKRGNYYFDNNWNYHVWNDMLNGTSAQVKGICDKYAPQYQAACDDHNKELANLAK